MLLPRDKMIMKSIIDQEEFYLFLPLRSRKEHAYILLICHNGAEHYHQRKMYSMADGVAS